MKLLRQVAVLLVIMIGVQLASAQTTFQPGSKAIVIAQKVLVHTKPSSKSMIVRELTRGFSSMVVQTQLDDQGVTWVYLFDGAYGWVELDGSQTLVSYSDEGLAQIESEATTILASEPQNVDALLARAEAESSQHDYGSAVIDLTHAISAAPDQARLYYFRGAIYLVANAPNQTISDGLKAESLNYHFPALYNLIGNGYNAGSDKQTALTYFQQATQAAPDFGLAYANIAAVNFSLQNYVDALQIEGQALQLDPNLLFVYLKQAGGYEKLGKHDLALERYNALITKAPFYAEGYIERGNWYASVNFDYARALLDYNQAIILDPSNDDAYDNRGVNYIFTGDAQNALSDLKQAIALNDSNDHAHFTLAGLYAALGYYQLGADQYGALIERSTSSYAYSSLLYRPQLYIALGDDSSALNDLKQFIQLHTDTPNYFLATALILRASIYTRQGDFANGNESMRLLLQIQPDFAQDYFAIGGGYRVAPNRQDDIAMLQQATLANPQDADAQLKFAAISVEFGLWQQAHDAFARYTQLSGHQGQVFDNFKARLQQLLS